MNRADYLNAANLLTSIAHRAEDIFGGQGRLTDEEADAIERARLTASKAADIAALWGDDVAPFVARILEALPIDTIAAYLAHWRRIDARVQAGEIVVAPGTPVEVYEG